jgi:hypothetical protein
MCLALDDHDPDLICKFADKFFVESFFRPATKTLKAIKHVSKHGCNAARIGCMPFVTRLATADTSGIFASEKLDACVPCFEVRPLSATSNVITRNSRKRRAHKSDHGLNFANRLPLKQCAPTIARTI